MDVVKAFLYGSLYSDIYMKIPKRFKMLEVYNSTSREMYSIKLQRFLFGIKYSRHMWCNRLSKYLSKEGYKNDPICPLVL